jgi:hypothetical protein
MGDHQSSKTFFNPSLPLKVGCMNDQRVQTFLGAVRKQWQSFLPAWIFPIVFFYGGKVADGVGHPNLFLFVVAIPLFLWSYGRASAVWIRREISYRHAVLMGLVTPFVIWIVVVLIQSTVASLLRT